MLKKSGLIFKSPVATVLRMHHLVSFIFFFSMDSSGSRYRATYAVPFLSVLIRIHVIHPNNTVSSVNEHC